MDPQFPAWYQSTQGPQTSQTIINIAANVIPLLNLVLASKGINLLPEEINAYISIAVFALFSVRAVLGYVKAKKLLGAHVAQLTDQLGRFEAQNKPAPIDRLS